MAIQSVTYRGKLDVVEVPSGAGIAPTSVVNHTLFSGGVTAGRDDVYGPTTTPACNAVADFQQALASGAATIDLTALPSFGGSTQSFNGKKVVAVKFRNPSTNANAITITQGGTNPYGLLGTTFSITLQPGQEFLFGPQAAITANTPVVSATVKAIALTGTASQALDVLLVAG
jgi:hypothetical protein